MRTYPEGKFGGVAADEVTSRVAFDFEAGVKFVFIYIPDSPGAIDVIDHYISDIQEALKVTEIPDCL